MTFGGIKLTNIKGAMGRTLRGVRTTQDLADTDFDPYSRAPALRSDIEMMLAEEVEGVFEADVEVEKLNEAEKVEHNRMCQIRGALYPAE